LGRKGRLSNVGRGKEGWIGRGGPKKTLRKFWCGWGKRTRKQEEWTGRGGKSEEKDEKKGLNK